MFLKDGFRCVFPSSELLYTAYLWKWFSFAARPWASTGTQAPEIRHRRRVLKPAQWSRFKDCCKLMACKIWSVRPQLIYLSCQWPPSLLFTALLPLHAYEKTEGKTDANNKEAEASGLALICPLSFLADHVFLSLRQKQNYTRFIGPHSIFILIMLNGAVNKWLALVQRGRNWWEMQITVELGILRGHHFRARALLTLEWTIIQF